MKLIQTIADHGLPKNKHLPKIEHPYINHDKTFSYHQLLSLALPQFYHYEGSLIFLKIYLHTLQLFVNNNHFGNLPIFEHLALNLAGKDSKGFSVLLTRGPHN